MNRGTHSKVAAGTTQFAEVSISSAHDGLVYADLGAIAQLDGQV
jgi:hypothetical protein